MALCKAPFKEFPGSKEGIRLERFKEFRELSTVVLQESKTPFKELPGSKEATHLERFKEFRELLTVALQESKVPYKDYLAKEKVLYKESQAVFKKQYLSLQYAPYIPKVSSTKYRNILNELKLRPKIV